MTDINNTAALAEPKKQRKKFCFAVIPAFFLTFISSFSAISSLVLVLSEINNAFLFTAILNLVSALCWLILSVFLIFKQNNIATPVFLGVTLILPNFLGFIFSYVQYDNYIPSFLQIYGIFWRVIVTAVCVLFVLKAPALKTFIKKTRFIWVIAASILAFFQLVFSAFDYIPEAIHRGELILQIFLYLFGASLYILPEAITIVLLLLWLSDPYKKIRPQKPAAPVAQPVYQPVYQPAAQTVAPPTPVVQPPIQTQPAAQANVADEIKKYKELLDSGAITPEDFESAKAKLLNKI